MTRTQVSSAAAATFPSSGDETHKDLGYMTHPENEMVLRFRLHQGVSASAVLWKEEGRRGQDSRSRRSQRPGPGLPGRSQPDSPRSGPLTATFTSTNWTLFVAAGHLASTTLRHHSFIPLNTQAYYLNGGSPGRPHAGFWGRRGVFSRI
ncbi:hypothetical protein DENSPDRAFT_852717 [Dentipellis sp. KUC8613]|nr:hypothetical protein DENSPDRAFT_852717 [Dentipellis sp. KUC8613]